MKYRALFFGVLCYGSFVGVFSYLILFIGDLWLDQSISSGSSIAGYSAYVINSGLLLLWGIQHSLMARTGFKAWLSERLPELYERSFYVLMSSLVLLVLMLFWQPQSETIWRVNNNYFVGVIWLLFVMGWGLALYATFLTSHTDLFGLRQSYINAKGKEYTPVQFTERGLYRWIRHPMMLGMLMAFWAAPHMTVSRLLFSVGMTLYVIIGIYFEEQALSKRFGTVFEEYRSRTDRLIPNIY